ncbi:hypothetical protein [Metabacillus endolithicus]|uniref:Uncharacterized protein n=2 Tax=Metabacillus endolithicus TaxID=1535204 RepID=A0ABW5C451_9BACI|nr:hypothetical protein [Metabacillus endolithicus]UPG66070.1 hypothetical protein MVE64_26890 [Metabacillus endolithicus]
MNKTFRIEDRVYFATSARKDEIEIIKKVRPANLLVSFALWREKHKDKCLKKDLIQKIDYTPKSIIVDSGAFTFGNIDIGIEEIIETYKEMIEEDGKEFTFEEFSWWWFNEFPEMEYCADKNQFLLFEQYINFILANQKYIDYCIAFDTMGSNETGLLTFKVMQSLGLYVIPVYQAATFLGRKVIQNRDFDVLKYYTDHTQYIAIGGTAISRINGYTKKFRIKSYERYWRCILIIIFIYLVLLTLI